MELTTHSLLLHKIRKNCLILAIRIGEFAITFRKLVGVIYALLFGISMFFFLKNQDVFSFISICIFGALLAEKISPRIWAAQYPYIAANEALATRILRISDLIYMAEEKIEIISGELHHSVYNTPEVIRAFRQAVDKDVSVHIRLTRSSVDAESKELFELLREAGAQIDVIVLPGSARNMPNHSIIIDDSHVRLEYSHLPNAERKVARIFVGRPDIVKEIQKFLIEKLMNASYKAAKLSS